MTAVTRIDQVIPTLASRDAIGGHVMQLRDLLRSRGYASDIFYGNASPDRLDEGLPITRVGEPSSTGRVLLYQLSIGSGVADIFRDRPERKFVNYHNITPADLLEAWIPQVGEEVRWGRAQLRELASVTEFAIADSEYNESELLAAGYPSTTTVPLLIDPEDFTGSPDPVLSARLGGAISEEYQRAVERFAGELDLADAVEFAGSVTHEELIAYYEHCDVFLCLSNHEGFCVPLLESMYHRLPIVSYQFTAVPETVAQAGLILPDKEPARVAAAIHRVVEDARLRAELATAAGERVDWFALHRVQDGFVAALETACAA